MYIHNIDYARDLFTNKLHFFFFFQSTTKWVDSGRREKEERDPR